MAKKKIVSQNRMVAEPNFESASIASGLAAAESQSISCLLIEDALFIREVYRIVLKKTAVHIVGEVGDGIEAMIKLAELKPQIAILDLVLPLKNGFEVLKEAERVSPKTKIIVVSSLDEEKYQKKALALGALKFLKKPFTKQELLDAISEVTTSYGEIANG